MIRRLMNKALDKLRRDDDAPDWTDEVPSDVLLAAGLLKSLAERLDDDERRDVVIAVLVLRALAEDIERRRDVLLAVVVLRVLLERLAEADSDSPREDRE